MRTLELWTEKEIYERFPETRWRTSQGPLITLTRNKRESGLLDPGLARLYEDLGWIIKFEEKGVWPGEIEALQIALRMAAEIIRTTQPLPPVTEDNGFDRRGSFLVFTDGRFVHENIFRPTRSDAIEREQFSAE